MKAVAYQASHPIDHPDALIDTILPDPIAQGRDLLVDLAPLPRTAEID